MFDTLINTLCILLQFSFFGTKYYKLFCNSLHDRCKYQMQKIAIKKVAKNIMMKDNNIGMTNTSNLNKLHLSVPTISAETSQMDTPTVEPDTPDA